MRQISGLVPALVNHSAVSIYLQSQSVFTLSQRGQFNCWKAVCGVKTNTYLMDCTLNLRNLSEQTETKTHDFVLQKSTIILPSLV